MNKKTKKHNKSHTPKKPLRPKKVTPPKERRKDASEWVIAKPGTNFWTENIKKIILADNPNISLIWNSGLEPENPETESEMADDSQVSPLRYDPSSIRVAFRQYPIDLIIKRISENAINLNTGYQRASDIWDIKAKSRLIESLLIKIPLPVFYLDSSNEDCWDVIDGIQRLNTFKSFAIDKSLKLKGLEFLPELNGKGFDDLPRNLQRRFLESYVSLYLIEKGTPRNVKISIYERINTGGTTLVPQEIRHAIFQGNASKLLEDLAESRSFKTATNHGINSLRMADRECILRFIAFYLTNYEFYKARDMDRFLNDTMERLSQMSLIQLDDIKHAFKRAMEVSYELFGKNAFRKPQPKSQINKALFETISSTIAKLDDRSIRLLIEKKKTLKSRFQKIVNDNDFIASISSGTGDVRKVQLRFERINSLIHGVVDL